MTDVVNPKSASPDQLLPYHKKISAEGKALMKCFISYTYMVLKSLQYAGLVNWLFCCASRNMDSHRLHIVFSAGIRLVTERGMVWEGGNGKKGYPQKGIVAPRWKASMLPFPVLAPLPFPVQLQCLYNRIFHLFRRRPR